MAIQKTGDTVAVVKSLAIGNTILEYFMSTMQDFWFYKYHRKIYPYFVDHFTKEVDLLNYLQIKPSFLSNFQDISAFEEQAELYNKMTNIHERAPEDRYFLSAIKNIYSYNFLVSISGFVILNVFERFLKGWKK